MARLVAAALAVAVLTAGCSLPSGETGTAAQRPATTTTTTWPDTPEGDFRRAMNVSPLTREDNQSNLVKAGRLVCDSLNDHFSFAEVSTAMVDAGAEPSKAGYIIGAGVRAFCPGFVPAMNRFVKESRQAVER